MGRVAGKHCIFNLGRGVCVHCAGLDTNLVCTKAELEASVPSTTLASNNSASSVNSQTKRCARALRVLLEGLDNIRNVRKQILQRALYEAESDNIKSRVMRQAAGIERWAEVQPSMFEDTLDQELGKYDKFKTDLEDGAVEQQKLLEEIEVSVLSAPSCE